MQVTLKNIQALRFLAALGVIFAHIDLSRYREGIKPELFGAGAFGVDLFFVLSGFIMPYVAQNMRGSRIRVASEFFCRRVLRVAPLYWLFTMMAFVLALMSVACPAGLSSCPFWLGEHYPLSKTSFRWVLQSLTFTNWNSNPIYDVGWTLIYEFWFYVLFSLSLLVSAKATKFFSLMIAAIFATHFLAIEIGSIQILFHPMMLEFILGVCLFYLFSARRFPVTLAVPAVIAAVCFALLYQVDFITHTLVVFSRPLLLGSAAFCIVAIALVLETADVKANATLVKLGDMSYSLYLSHWLVVTTFPSLLDVYNVSGISFLTYIMLNVVFSLMLSLVVFYFVENPLRKASSAKIKQIFHGSAVQQHEVFMSMATPQPSSDAEQRSRHNSAAPHQ